MLKKLAQAQRDDDLIYAVVRGSAINQDGRSNGLTAPNPASQEAVLSAALKDARVSPAEVAYVEAHGTGTKLGDPIELTALGRVLVSGSGRIVSKDGPLRVGSVKTNIGHLEPAAGIANVIKAALILKHNWIPPSLNMQTPNEHVDFDELGIKIVTKGQELATGSSVGHAIVSTSSFGFGGTNAHVVMQQAKDTARAKMFAFQKDRRKVRPVVLPLSAVHAKSICSTAARYERSIAASKQSWSIEDVAWTAARYRMHGPRQSYRAAVIADDEKQMQAGLADIANGKSNSKGDSIVVGKTVELPARVAFVFTGQGAQHNAMCQELFEKNETFRSAMEECEMLLNQHMKSPLLATLYSGNDDGANALQDPAFSQPALFRAP